MMKQTMTSILLLALAAFAAPAGALTVYADLDGDMLYDNQASFTPGDVFTASIYADVDNAHGGLAGFGVAAFFDEPPISVYGVPSQAANNIIDPQWNFLAFTSVGVGTATAGGSTLPAVGFVGPSASRRTGPAG